MTKQIKRGDIYYASLNPVLGAEQGNTRPCLVVQNNIGNQHSPTVMVVPLTSSKKSFLPTHVRISRTGGLVADSTALCEQVRTIDRIRFDGYVGRVDANAMEAVNDALAISMGLAKRKSYRAKVLVLSLCPSCVSDFETVGRVLIKRGWQKYMEACDICRVSRGWSFGVFDNGEELEDR